MNMEYFFAGALSLLLLLQSIAAVYVIGREKKKGDTENGRQFGKKQFWWNLFVALVSVRVGYLYLMKPWIEGRAVSEHFLFYPFAVLYLAACLSFVAALICYLRRKLK